MIHTKESNLNSNIIQFLPGIIFLATYTFLYYYTINTTNTYHSTKTIFAGLPLCAAFIATFYAYFTFQNTYNIQQKFNIFLSGASYFTANTACFEFICIPAVSYVLAKTNAVLTAVTISLLYIPTYCMLPALFIIPGLIAIIIPSLPITILLYLPIAHGIAQSLHINTASVVATVMSGALCGTHLMISLRKKNKSLISLSHIFWFILAAGISSLIIFSQNHMLTLDAMVYQHLQEKLQLHTYITLLPYACLIITNLYKIHLLATLILTFCVALGIEIFYYKICFLDVCATMFQGFYQLDIAGNILLFHIIMAGLTHIMISTGGFAYIFKKLKATKKQSTIIQYISMLSMIVITNLIVVIPNLALHLLRHPLHILNIKYQTPEHTIKKFVYIISTMIQILVPYSGIMLLAMHTTHTTYFQILQQMFYPCTITCLLITTTYITSIKAKSF